jgi:hypothetical protein
MESMSISTPALLFSGLSLFILAFTNRFHAVAQIIRQFIAEYQKEPDHGKLLQIKTFEARLKYIKYTQVFAVLSFLSCVISMLAILIGADYAAKAVFLASLFLITISLLLALLEVLTSITALNIELKKIEK